MLTPKIKTCFLVTFLCMACISSALAAPGKKSFAVKDTTSQTLDSPYFLSGGIYLGEHFAYQGGVESDFNKRLTIGARFSKIHLIDFPNMPCNNGPYIKYCADGYVKELSIYAGKTFYFKKYFSFSAVTGPSLIDYDRPTSFTTTNYTYPFPYTEYHYTYSDNKVLGWATKIELRAAPLKFAAIGFGLFYNYNKLIQFGGAMISLEIGKFR